MTILTIDIETNLKQDTIWCCICGRGSVDSMEFSVFTDRTGLQTMIDQADVIVGHNLIGFDRIVLFEVWGIKIPIHKVVDTLILSRMNHKHEGGNSLKEWGIHLKMHKGDFTDFDSGLCDEMIDYCKQDVRICRKLYDQLYDLLVNKSEYGTDCIELENRVQVIATEQERNGFKLDLQKANKLYQQTTTRMMQIERELRQVFPPIVEQRISEKTGKRLKDKVTEFNIGSRQQIAERLKSKGAKFKDKTEKNNIIVNEKVLEGIDLPEAKLVLEYLLCQKRASQIDQWLNAIGDDGRVHGKMRTLGTVTGRMSHNSPNIAQIPAVNKPYGKECRECWTVDEGNKLVGIDASGLELRMLAHYMDDAAYTREILEGDIHTANQKAAGIATRDKAKTFIYAFLYGAGVVKIGSIVGGSARDGTNLKKKFLENTPALAELMQKVEHEAETNGCVVALDGRKLHIRSSHAALNTLLQGAGAIVMKRALVIFKDTLKENSIPHKIVANVHDEWQVEAPERFAKAVGLLGVGAIQLAGDYYRLNCPLDGEYKVGDNWAGTH
jgi:DNA polymerase-1